LATKVTATKKKTTRKAASKPTRKPIAKKSTATKAKKNTSSSSTSLTSTTPRELLRFARIEAALSAFKEDNPFKEIARTLGIEWDEFKSIMAANPKLQEHVEDGLFDMSYISAIQGLTKLAKGYKKEQKVIRWRKNGGPQYPSRLTLTDVAPDITACVLLIAMVSPEKLSEVKSVDGLGGVALKQLIKDIDGYTKDITANAKVIE